jgi:type II secretory pathway pseudopilin PulG
MRTVAERTRAAEAGATLVEVIVATALLMTVTAAFVPAALAVARVSRSAETAGAVLTDADLLERRVGAGVRAAVDVLEAGPDRLVLGVATDGAPGVATAIITYALRDGALVEERAAVGIDGAVGAADLRTLVPDAVAWQFAYRTWDGRDVDAVPTQGAGAVGSSRPLLVRLLGPAPSGPGQGSPDAVELGAWSVRLGHDG